MFCLLCHISALRQEFMVLLAHILLDAHIAMAKIRVTERKEFKIKKAKCC